MNDLDPSEFDVDTLAIRSAQLRTDEMAHSDPIFLTSSFVYESAAQAAARFYGEEPGNIYSRFTNPTVSAFEQRLAAMEGGVAVALGVATAVALVTQVEETPQWLQGGAGDAFKGTTATKETKEATVKCDV